VSRRGPSEEAYAIRMGERRKQKMPFKKKGRKEKSEQSLSIWSKGRQRGQKEKARHRLVVQFKKRVPPKIEASEAGGGNAIWRTVTRRHHGSKGDPIPRKRGKKFSENAVSS